MHRTNIRVVSKFGRVSGEYIFDPFDWTPNHPKHQRVMADLDTARKLEPQAGYKIQTRGDFSDWHDMEEKDYPGR